MFITLTFSCFPETKKRRVRGVEDMFTSIITSLPFSFHEKFPDFYFDFTPTSPFLKKREKYEETMEEKRNSESYPTVSK
jgi:hypothetical protein